MTPRLWALGLLGLLAWAHQPFWNPGSPHPETPYPVVAPEVSQALFGQLAPGERAFFRLQVPAGFTLRTSLFVGEGCHEGFRPTLWLLGPGLGGQAPLPLPPGWGAIRQEAPAWTPYRGHGLRARRGPRLEVELRGGTYLLAVEAGMGEGYYLLSLDGLEVPGGSLEGLAAIPRFNRCR
uniref:Uncharacterized protein n=2 Tax=Thermus caliditerrae TaxID=1330700 RepID=A0A7C5RES0_9DEIN